MTRLFVLFVFSLLASLRADAAVPAFNGVWEGSLGAKEIVACFNTGFPSASYYYTQFLKPIQLSPMTGDSFWHEENQTGLWELKMPSNGTVSGSWHSADGKKSLPIQLHLISGSTDEKACAEDAYNKRLETAPKVEYGKKQIFQPGQSYRTVRYAGQETIELFGTGAAISKVNQELKQYVSLSKKAVQDYFDQRRQFLGEMGSPSTDELITEPVYWTPNWITIKFYRWTAGTGRNGISVTYRTWDMQTGKKVDLWTWLGTTSDDDSDTGTLPAKLAQHLLKDQKKSPDCASYPGQGTYHLTLEPAGMKFWEEAFGSGCEQEFLVPYADLTPFLSPQGKRAVASFSTSQ